MRAGFMSREATGDASLLVWSCWQRIHSGLGEGLSALVGRLGGYERTRYQIHADFSHIESSW